MIEEIRDCINRLNDNLACYRAKQLKRKIKKVDKLKKKIIKRYGGFK